MYEITLECAMVPRGCYPRYPFLLPPSLFPSPFSALFPLFHSSRPGCATTHRHHLAIHLGPVLLITRLELRTREPGPRESGRRARTRLMPLKRRSGGKGGTPEHNPPRRPLARDHRPFLVPRVGEGSGSLSLSSRLSVSRQLALPPSPANDGFFTARPLRVLCTRPTCAFILYAECYSARRAITAARFASSSRSRVISRLLLSLVCSSFFSSLVA